MFSRLDSSLKLFGALIIVIVACLAILPYMSSQQANATLDALKHAADKERAYNAVLDLLKDAETGQRGYLIGNDDAFLQPYNVGIARIPAALDMLKRHAESADEKALVAQIAELSHAKIGEMERAIQVKKSGDSQAALDIVASQRGRRLMDQLRAILGRQLSVLAEHRMALREEITASLHYNTALGVGASLASLVLICSAVFLAKRSLNQRAEAARKSQELADSNAQLAQLAAMRAERLSVTADMLQALDSVKSPAELARILPVFLRTLLPGTSGAVYIYRNSRDVLELKAAWGAADSMPEMVAPEDCWGLRLGKMHVAARDHGLCCEHGNAWLAAHDTQTCVPMISQGDVIGVLVIAADRRDGSQLEKGLFATLAEQLSLAVSNVTLRETLRHQSTIDPLTGLYNRRFFDESLKRELARAQRSRAACSVVMIDLDHFKRINDTYGHEGGDLVLKAAARVIMDRVRASDVVCRYGGEELVLMLPDCTGEEAAKCAESIRVSLTELLIQHQGQAITGISASFGIAQWPGKTNGDLELVQAADRALYAAKKAGRNRVVLAGAESSLSSVPAEISAA